MERSQKDYEIRILQMYKSTFVLLYNCQLETAGALMQYVGHFHHERNHHGKGNVLLFPSVSQDTEREGPMQCWHRRHHDPELP